MARLGDIELDAPLILAPMAGATNPPFRTLCRELGAGLVVTEMVSAKGIVNDDAKTWSYVDLQPHEKPVSVQLFGCDPDELAEAARKVAERGADSVDVNMGCPMKKVVKTGRGAALLQDPPKVERIMRAMSDAVDIPVTAKIRAGWETSNAVEVARAIEQGGGAGLAIHGRTRSAMYEHHVDLDVIADVAGAVDIAVFGNGDVRCVDSCDRMLATGCDGVMIARGCLGNPWIFDELRAHLDGRPPQADRTPEGVRAMMHRHLALYVKHLGARRTCLEFRKHALWYLKGSAGEPVLRARLRGLDTVEAVKAAIDAGCDALSEAAA